MTEINPLKGYSEVYVSEPERKNKSRPLLNVILFLLTFFTTTSAGVAWLNRDPFDLSNFRYGLTYSFLILTFLTFHEFGHYFAAKIHKVRVTLPYYIPFPLVLNPFGTMGAVIRIKQQITSRKALFDIGIAGPVAGFVVSFAMLVYGMLTLPPFEYIYTIHPEYMQTGVPLSGFSFGYNLLYYLLGEILASSPDVFLPPMNEMYHYPFLCVGWFGLFVTALNLLPVGQLDGGHIIYALFGSKSKYIARTFFALMLFMGLLGLLPFFGIYFLADYGLLNWLIWAALIFFVIRIEHPPFYDPEPIGTARKLWGVFALIMFILCFTPVPVSGI
ncbi:MAG: site-2 protease family protein [Ignavibacteria bacterium]|nr:site-2 protease family protein [Ignavibacteria bacterium]